MEKGNGGIDYTKQIAKRLSEQLKKGDTVFLYGTLGAGKTTFVKYVLEHFGYLDNVNSPTFVLERIYKIKDLVFYHLDLYRLKEDQLYLLEFLNEKDQNGIYLIEWPEIIEHVIQPNYKVYLNVVSEKIRDIKIQKNV